MRRAGNLAGVRKNFAHDIAAPHYSTGQHFRKSIGFIILLVDVLILHALAN